MKLSIKSAGLCASGAIILTTYTALFNQQQPLEILQLALPWAFIAGFLGYQIGAILSTPKGGAAAPAKKAARPTAEKKSPRPVTGNETFLDDLDEDLPPGTEPVLELFDTPSPRPEAVDALSDEEPTR